MKTDNYNIKDNMIYQGIVTLSVTMKNGKKVDLITYNHALPKLSEVFARAMCGYDVSSNIPRYLMAKQGSAETPLLIYPVLLTGTNYSIDETGYYYVSYNALITSSMVAGVQSNDEPIYLVLLDSEENELAQISLIDSSGAEITDMRDVVGEGKNLLINWKLKLTNTNDYNVPEVI